MSRTLATSGAGSSSMLCESVRVAYDPAAGALFDEAVTTGALTTAWLPDPTSTTGATTSWPLGDPFANTTVTITTTALTGTRTLDAFGDELAPPPAGSCRSTRS